MMANPLYSGFVTEVSGLLPYSEHDVRRLPDPDLRTEHNWAHRFHGNITASPTWGSAQGWSVKKVKRIHDWLVGEGRRRGADWAVNHQSPMPDVKKK